MRGFKPCFSIVPAVLWLAAVLAPVCSNAGAVQPCERPRIFPYSAVNVVVLPFTERAGAPSEVADKLIANIATEVLISALRYESIGVVRLLPPTAPPTIADPAHPAAPWSRCGPDDVLQRVIDEWRPRYGLVLVWGFIYEAGGYLYVQTFVRFAQRGVRDGVTIDGGAPSGYSFESPSTSVALPPHRFTAMELKAIDEQVGSALTLRDADNDAAKVVEALPLRAGSPVSYTVLDAHDNWIHVDASPGGRGWIHARSDESRAQLRQWLPELSFVNGVVGYLEARVTLSQGASTTSIRAPMNAANQSFDQYVAMTEASEAKAATALTWVLRGHLEILSSAPPDIASGKAIDLARGLYEKAAAVTPGDAHVAGLAAAAGAAECRGPTRLECVRRAASRSIEVLRRDPTNLNVIQGLETAYDALLKAEPALPSAEREAIVARRDALAALGSALSN